MRYIAEYTMYFWQEIEAENEAEAKEKSLDDIYNNAIGIIENNFDKVKVTQLELAYVERKKK